MNKISLYEKNISRIARKVKRKLAKDKELQWVIDLLLKVKQQNFPKNHENFKKIDNLLDKTINDNLGFKADLNIISQHGSKLKSSDVYNKIKKKFPEADKDELHQKLAGVLSDLFFNEYNDLFHEGKKVLDDYINKITDEADISKEKTKQLMKDLKKDQEFYDAFEKVVDNNTYEKIKYWYFPVKEKIIKLTQKYLEKEINKLK